MYFRVLLASVIQNLLGKIGFLKVKITSELIFELSGRSVLIQNAVEGFLELVFDKVSKTY